MGVVVGMVILNVVLVGLIVVLVYARMVHKLEELADGVEKEATTTREVIAHVRARVDESVRASCATYRAVEDTYDERRRTVRLSQAGNHGAGPR